MEDFKIQLPKPGTLEELCLVYRGMHQLYDRGMLSTKKLIEDSLRLMKELEALAVKK